MKKLLKITSRGETIITHGRVVRTPTDIKLTDDEFNDIKIQLRTKGITEEYYSFEPIVVVPNIKPIIEDITQEDKEPIIEEITLPDDLSYLERLSLK